MTLDFSNGNFWYWRYNGNIKLRNLDLEVISTAIGLVSSRASGLKSQFGTMGKPFNAGAIAAMVWKPQRLLGLRLAEMHLPVHKVFLQNIILQKTDKKVVKLASDEFFFFGNSQLYACCHGIIEALLEFVEGGSLTEDNFEMIRNMLGHDG